MNIKPHLFLLALAPCMLINPVNAFEYSYPSAAVQNVIHSIEIIKGWCGNLKISTKVGHFENGACHYIKETASYGYDGCTYQLNGKLLESKVGLGYDCAATRVVSGRHEKLDEFHLLRDSTGHYVGSKPAYSRMELPK